MHKQAAKNTSLTLEALLEVKIKDKAIPVSQHHHTLQDTQGFVYSHSSTLKDVITSYNHKNASLTFPLPTLIIQGLFAKFTDSPYYSESELCGSAVMVSFLKYLPWQVMHFL
jgi:hypothetical protein